MIFEIGSTFTFSLIKNKILTVLCESSSSFNILIDGQFNSTSKITRITG